MKTMGVYCGSFNPFHLGHKDIVEKGLELFDVVFIGVGINPSKDSNGLFSRAEAIKEIFKDECRVIIEPYQGLTTDLIDKLEENNYYTKVTLIRGIRDGFDLDYESKNIRFMEDMKPDLKVILILGDREYSHLSSSAIRGLETLDNSPAKNYLP